MNRDIGEIGRYGEELAKDILSQMGFVLESKLLDVKQQGNPSYDILARRNGQRYAINVKFGKNFIIQPRNLERLLEVYTLHKYTPAFFFLISPEIYWFYSLDHTFPLKINFKDKKLESFNEYVKTLDELKIKG